MLAAIRIAGTACFFIGEGIEKTPDSESGLGFKRFFSDLKKPRGYPLSLFIPEQADEIQFPRRSITRFGQLSNAVSAISETLWGIRI